MPKPLYDTLPSELETKELEALNSGITRCHPGNKVDKSKTTGVVV